MPCSICGGSEHEAEPHETWEHSEDWVNLADARYTGEVIFMPNTLLINALEVVIPELFVGKDLHKQMVHVDRRIIGAIVTAYDSECYGNDGTDQLFSDISQYLVDNPVRKSL